MNAIKRVVLTAVLLSFVLTASVAMADAPAIQINSIPVLAYASFPQTYVVTGTISHTHNNLNSLKDLTFSVNGVTLNYDSKPYTGNDIRTSTTISFPWTINEPGTYTIVVSARHGGFLGTASQTVTVTLLVPDDPDEGRAAPAIAADYLKRLGYKPNDSEYKNIIAQVTDAMYPGTDFGGFKKSDVAAYESAVEAYIDSLL